ncbi:MAG: SIMPL domain-containing protein, partial [Hyphomonadaceae bacterium]
GYQANNSVTAKVRRIDTTGRVIDAAVAAGGNTVNGVSFSHSDPDAQLDIARRDAIAEARRRAELYASALGLRVNRIVSISEGGGYAPPMPVALERFQAQDAAAPTPVSPGQIETRVSVNVMFELR